MSHPSDNAVGSPATLLQVTYTSTLDCTPLLLGPRQCETAEAAAVHEIVVAAQRPNARRAITGALYFCQSSKRIVQILEGPEGAVENLLTTIKADARHTDIKVVNTSTTKVRVFPERNMNECGKEADWDNLLGPAGAKIRAALAPSVLEALIDACREPGRRVASSRPAAGPTSSQTRLSGSFSPGTSSFGSFFARPRKSASMLSTRRTKIHRSPSDIAVATPEVASAEAAAVPTTETEVAVPVDFRAEAEFETPAEQINKKWAASCSGDRVGSRMMGSQVGSRVGAGNGQLWGDRFRRPELGGGAWEDEGSGDAGQTEEGKDRLGSSLRPPSPTTERVRSIGSSRTYRSNITIPPPQPGKKKRGGSFFRGSGSFLERLGRTSTFSRSPTASKKIQRSPSDAGGAPAKPSFDNLNLFTRAKMTYPMFVLSVERFMVSGESRQYVVESNAAVVVAVCLC